jgi:hypothetical protein
MGVEKFLELESMPYLRKPSQFASPRRDFVSYGDSGEISDGTIG